jgi:hypothetical protein
MQQANEKRNEGSGMRKNLKQVVLAVIEQLQANGVKVRDDGHLVDNVVVGLEPEAESLLGVRG